MAVRTAKIRTPISDFILFPRVEQRHHLLRITRASDGVRREHALDLGEVGGGQLHVERPEVLIEIADAARPRDRDDVWTLRKHPRERELRGGAALARGQRLHVLDQRKVAREIFALETRLRPALVVRREIVETLDLAGQEAATERAVGDERDA